MRSQYLLALGAAAWLIAAHSAFGDEVGAPGDKAEAPQTNASNSMKGITDDSMIDEGPAPQRLRGGGNVEWRRTDHPNAGANRSGNRSSGGKSGASDGGDGGSSSSD